MKKQLLVLAMPFVLLSACKKADTTKVGKSLGTDVVHTVMVGGAKVDHPVHGLETWFAIGAMNASPKVAANGMAQSHVFADGATLASINLNIAAAPKGFVYVGWLIKPGSTERIRMGAMENPLGDVRHQVTLEVAKDLQEYLEVQVTKEHTSGPKEDDPVLATGTLKEQKR